MNWKTVYLALAHQVGPLWSFFKVAVPVAISVIALWITLKDRRPRLRLKARKGKWCILRPATDGREFIFSGIIEVYNVSARANAIRGYEMWGKRDNGHWEKMDSERYRMTVPDFADAEVFNHTPITLAPYSGIEVYVQGIAKMPQPYEMDVKVLVEDLFGKQYHVVVRAFS